MVLRSQTETVEAKIAGIWAAALGIEQVERRTSFTELGGHSLQAAQIAEQVARTFGVGDQARRLLGISTVAEQAEYIISLR